jgi:hypothetical protein
MVGEARKPYILKVKKSKSKDIPIPGRGGP